MSAELIEPNPIQPPADVLPAPPANQPNTERSPGWRQATGRALLAASLTLGATAGVEMAHPPAAMADGDVNTYSFGDATALSESTDDYGYATCPSSDTGCKNYSNLKYTLNGIVYGEADPWGYALRNCTSYVAEKINQEFGISIAGWGDAYKWKAAAMAAGYTLDDTPQVGDIAGWGTEVGGGHGHVAYVAAVDSSGVPTFDEYNVHLTGEFTNDYTSKDHPASPSAPDWYVHIGTPKDGSSSGSAGAGSQYPDGEYIESPNGAVYIVVGGAAVGLPNWASVGGSKTIGAHPTQDQINAMPKVPQDGTFVEAYNTSTVYEIAGGAAFGVPSSAAVGNSISKIDEIPDGTSFQQYPRDETFVEEYGSSTVYETVGGAAIPVPSWASVGAPDQQHVAMIPDGGLGQLASRPADGTFVEQYNSSTVEEIAGGAAFPLPNWDSVGGSEPVVPIPEGTSFAEQPPDGTYVQPYGNGTIYLVAGGAAMPLSTWNAVGGAHNVAQIPSDGLSQFLPEPRDGTFVAEYGSPAVSEIAGGAEIPLPNWASVGGQEPTTMIPDGALAQIPTTPANGTFVEAYGSPTVDEIAGGAAFPLSNWSQVGGAQPVSQVPAGTTFATLPADGTYIEEYGNPTVNVTAGGAALEISSWNAVGGSEPVTTIPTGAIASQLLAYPANGTYVKGYGSGEEFEAMNGAVTQVTTSPLPASTTVDDWAVVNQLGGTE